MIKLLEKNSLENTLQVQKHVNLQEKLGVILMKLMEVKDKEEL